MATKLATVNNAVPPSPLALLREPFPPNQISKLPKETRAQIDARKADKNVMLWKCEICGGAHHKNATHLDYVGHAALTDRLLDTDLEWSWEPVAFVDGLPAFDRNGGLWIKLTVAGVTRYGYGSADGKSGGDAVKEVIGDALRNAAMRFGAALDLWHKGDLHADEESEEAPAPVSDPRPATGGGKISDTQFVVLQGLMEAAGSDVKGFCEFFRIPSVKDLPAARYEEAVKAINASAAKRGRNPQRSEIIADEIPY
jgi:hypothetical protein